MPKIITEKSFYKYLKCPSWIAHDAKEERLVENDLRTALQQDGLLRERQLALLANRPFTEVVTEDMDEAVMKTLALMREGVQTIFRPVLMRGHWVARPDLLERVQGRSAFGDYYYVACDIKRSRRLKEEYCFQGCFYAELLKHAQGTKPQQGYVMHPNGEVESYLLEEYAVRFHLTLDSITRILEGEDEPHFLTSDCKQSPWFAHCKHTSVSCDDLTRMNRVWRSEVHALHDAGIRTVADLARITKDFFVAHVHGITGDRFAFLQEQAKALVEDRVIIYGDVPLSDAPSYLVIDVESDPLRDVHYLFGVLPVDGAVTQPFVPFLAKTETGERAMWEQFCAFLLTRPLTEPIFHYGWYEVDVVKHLREQYGMPAELGDITTRMVDVLTTMRERVIFPLSFYSLKDVAKYLGFRWRTEDAGGMDSVDWYEAWLMQGDAVALQRIVDYNEDDVRATLHVMQWVWQQKISARGSSV